LTFLSRRQTHVAQGTVFDDLNRAWERDPTVRLQPRDWQSWETLAGLSPDEIVSRNRDRTCDAAVKNSALLALVRLAKDDDLAARTVLQILTPAAKSLLARVGSIPGGPEERALLVVEVLWGLIRFYPCHRPGTVAGNLMGDLLRGVLAERPRGVTCVSLDTLSDSDACLEARGRMSTPAEELLEVLTDAVAGGLIPLEGARLIAQLRVAGVPAAELIGQVDRDECRPRFGSEQTVRQARRRVERRLKAALAIAAA
jgi:hypothetical protein